MKATTPTLASIALYFLCSAQPVGAALRLWTGAGPNDLWSTPANWNPAGAPQNGEDLGFLAGAPRQTSTNDLIGRTFHSFIFNGAGADYTLFGNSIALSAGANTLGTARGSLNFSLVTLAANQEFIADDSHFNVSSDVALNGHTLTLRATTSNSTASVIGSISGVGDVVKVGVGESLFGGPEGNTFQGTTYVTEGILKLGKGNIGNGLAVPGDLEIGSHIDRFDPFSDPFLFGKVVMLRANMVTNTGTITINHGSINQNGFDQVIGPLRLFDGGINTSNATLIPTATISQPGWPFTRYPSIDGHVSLPSDITFDLHGHGYLFLGATVSGGGGIILEGIGSLKVYNTNDFTGPVTVNGGLFWVNESTQALGQHPVVTVNDDGILGLDNVTIANKTLTITSPDAGFIAVSDPCTWTGPINLNFTGQAQVTAGFTFGGDSSTSLRLTGPIHGTGGLKFGGHLIELTGNNDFTGDVTAACELLKLNTGALRPFTGSLEVGGGFSSWGYDFGQLRPRDTNALCEVRWMDTAFQFVPRATIRTNGWANLNGHDNEFGSLDMTGGRISGGGGKLFLDGPVTTHPAATTALIEGLVQLSTFPAVRFDVADGPVDPDLRITAVISDGIPSAIDKEGDGEMLLTAANTYRNATTVGAGVLRIQNDNALGTTGAGTTVLDGGTLYNETAVALSEPLTLSGAGRGGTNGALFLGPATGVQADIVLAASTVIRNDVSFSILSGVISGPGGLSKTGPGSLQLGGGSGAPNTYGGDTFVLAGVMVLSKGTGVTTVPGHLIIGGGGGLFGASATVRHFAGFTIVGTVTVNRGGLWDLNGFSESFGVPELQGRPGLSLNTGGDVQTGAGTLFLPTEADVVVTPGTGLGFTSFISGNVGLGPGSHRFIVQKGVDIIGLDFPDLDLSAVISQTSSAADIVKEGSGEMRLGGSNSFTGALTVNGGLLTAANAFALGTVAGGTVVNDGASLALDGGITVGFEPLTLDTTNAAALLSLGSVTNIWRGNITLQRTAGFYVPEPGGVLRLESFFGCCPSTITGQGGLTKFGPGTVLMTGTVANNYTGPTTVNGGVLEASRTQGQALSSNVVVTGAGAVLRTGRSPAIKVLPTPANVAVENGGLWTMNVDNTETLSRLVGNGNLEIGSGGVLTLSNGVSCTFSGVVSGPGALQKRGLATLHFTGQSPNYTGPATVFDGTYKVDGYFANSPVTVKLSSILRGSGAVGDVTVESGGVVRVDPRNLGVLGGAMQFNSVNFQAGGILGAQFYGPHPTAGNDLLYVINGVTLSNPALSSGFQYPPREGDVITLVEKTGTGAITGAFSGFPAGTVQTIGQIPVLVSYAGGSGNDMTLTVTNLPLRGAGTQLLGGTGSAILLPNDCSRLLLAVTNRGATAATNLRATLRSLTEGILVTIPDAAYPNLAPNASGTNLSPFQIRTTADFPCGGSAQFELLLTASNLPPIAIVYTLTGASGYALDLDGRDDQVNVAANTFSGVVNNFTIELWANPTANRTVTAETNAGISGVSVPLRQLQRFAVFPDRGNLAYGATHVGAGLSIGRNGISAYEQGTNHLPSRLVYSNSVSGWTHVALVYASRQPRLYVNGVLVRSGSASLFPSVHPSASLGGSTQADYGNYEGQLDEVRIWNTALSQAQIQSNMTQRLTGTEAGLVTYFRCDEGSGSVLTDSASASPNPSGALADGAKFVLTDRGPFTVPGGPSCNSGGGACESCFVFGGTFATNTPTIPARLSAELSPSVCSPAKPCPGAFEIPGLPPTPFIQHTFTNTSGTPLCVTAQLHFDCPAAPGSALHAAAYLGTVDPDAPCLNYLGDSGGDGTAAFSFVLPAGSNAVVLVTQRAEDIGCDTYTLELFGLPCPPPTLQIARDNAPANVLLKWSSAYPDFRLQSANLLNSVPTPQVFSNVVASPALIDGRFTVTNSTTAPHQFFRLAK